MRKTFAAALALILMLCAAASAQVSSLNDSCKFQVSSGDVSAATDASFRTAWAPDGGEGELRISLPEDGAARILIGWKYPPENYTLTQYDSEMNVISTHGNADDEFACITALLPLEPEAGFLSLEFSQPGQAIQTVLVYPEGELPTQAVKWEKPHDKCDLMVISTHQDDEWLWFGAIIPYYDLVKGKDVQVVYMANCGRYRYQEALNGLAVSGVRTYPQFVGLTDRYDDSLEQAVNTWSGKDHILDVVVEVIRRYRPEVILTHDWNGEYGHPQHILTSRCMEYAIEAAADPAQYPDSAQRYGAWQVKKLYRHLEKKNEIEFDWHVSYPEFGGRTGIQVATDSMNQHASQLKWYQVRDHGKYDNALFGLSYSTVGDDVLHDDLFENIPEATPTVESTPEPTSEPLPTETEASPAFALSVDGGTDGPDDGGTAGAAIEDVEAPAPEAGTAQVPLSGGHNHSALPLAAVCGAALVATGGGAALLYRRNRQRRRRKAAKGRASAGQKRRGDSAHSDARHGAAATTSRAAHSAGAEATSHSRRHAAPAASSRTPAHSAAATVQNAATPARGATSPSTGAHSRHAASASAGTAARYGGSAASAHIRADAGHTQPASTSAVASSDMPGRSSTAGRGPDNAGGAPHTRREARLARRSSMSEGAP